MNKLARIKVTRYSGVKHGIECQRARNEAHAYAHTDIQLFTEEELEDERVWISTFCNDSVAVIDAVRRSYADDVATQRYIEVYVYFFKTVDDGGLECEVVVYGDME